MPTTVTHVTVGVASWPGAHVDYAGVATHAGGVHAETMRRWAREGAIPAAKLRNRGGFRFKRADLDRFLEARRRVD